MSRANFELHRTVKTEAKWQASERHLPYGLVTSPWSGSSRQGAANVRINFISPLAKVQAPSLFEERMTAEQLIQCLEGFYRYELGGAEEYRLKENLRHLTIQTFAGTVALVEHASWHCKETSEYGRSLVIAYTNPPGGIR